MLKVLADDMIPGVDLIDSCRSISLTLKSGRSIAQGDLKNIDVLIVRSPTRVNRELLEQASKLKFVASVTAGTDHIDKSVLQNRGIYFTAAPGSNANAVVDYVLASLCYLAPLNDLRKLSLGIVGAGNVGERLLQAARVLGLSCRVYDPWRTHFAESCCFEEVLQSDILSLHTSLVDEGAYPTRHMLRADQLHLRNGKLPLAIINTSRGEVLDNSIYEDRSLDSIKLICDVWSNEPTINIQHFARSEIATPHIAGHSRAAKWRASLHVFSQLATEMKLNIPALARFDQCFDQEFGVEKFDYQQPEKLSHTLESTIKLTEISDCFKQQGLAVRSARAMGLVFDALRRDHGTRSELDYSRLLDSID